MRRTSLWLGLLATLLFAAGCGMNNGTPLEKGVGDGHQWAPDKDGKFLVIDVDNQFAEDIEFVAHGRLGIFKMFVDTGKHQYMVLKDSVYEMELRTRKKDAGKAEFLQLEERVLGVRRIHLRVVAKDAAQAAKASAATSATPTPVKPAGVPAK